VRSGEYHRDIGAQKADAPWHKTGMAASVDRLEDVPVLRLYGSPPVQPSPKDLDEVGILGKRRCKADAVVTIPGSFDLLQVPWMTCSAAAMNVLLNEWGFYQPRQRSTKQMPEGTPTHGHCFF
jgi:hypothetical protein